MAGILIKVLIFFILTVLLSLIPANVSFSPKSDGIQVYIISNGVHTDFVLPVETTIMDWKSIFLSNQFKNGWKYASYIAFGWGDKGFFLKTPEWKDLRLKTALNALFIPSTSAMHVSLWPEPEENDLTCMVSMTEDQYQIIVNYILDSFKWGSDDQILQIKHPGYGKYDLFFESSLSFHLFRTCNVWTNQGLKKAGIRTSLWTQFDRPILYQISQIEACN